MARLVRISAIALALLGLTGPAVSAQTGFRDTVTVVPNKHYSKDFIYRFFFGDHYRDLWTTAIRVPVLDLATFAGGLTPTKKGGGQQTKSLRFKAGDGKQYQFRSVDKDPSAVLPLGLRETFADVPRGSPFYRFVEALVHNGVTSGCGVGVFCPGSAVTREQIAPFVLVAREGEHYASDLAVTTPTFSDVPWNAPSNAMTTSDDR